MAGEKVQNRVDPREKKTVVTGLDPMVSKGKAILRAPRMMMHKLHKKHIKVMTTLGRENQYLRACAVPNLAAVR